MISKMTLAILLGGFISSVAHAGDGINKLLIERGNWTVSKFATKEDPASDTCIAETSAGEQALTFYGDSYNNLQIVVWDNRWETGQKPVSFVMLASDNKWPVNGQANGSNISTDFGDRGKSLKFMIDIATGHNLVFTTTKGKSLAKFGLKGSTAAMITFADCWAGLGGAEEAAVGANSVDPFSE